MPVQILWNRYGVEVYHTQSVWWLPEQAEYVGGFTRERLESPERVAEALADIFTRMGMAAEHKEYV